MGTHRASCLLATASLLATLLPASAALASDASSSPEPEQPSATTEVPEPPRGRARWRFSTEPPPRVGVETSLLWPIYPRLFFHLKSTIPIHAARGEVLLGIQGRVPEDRPDEGEFSNLDGVLGWRQYGVHGIHFDVLFNLGWGRLRNSPIDGRDYDSFDIEIMALAGWRFGVGPLYFVIQPAGIANVVYKSDPWPIRGKGRPRTEGPIYVGNVLLGVQF